MGHSYRDLLVWRKSLDFATTLYRVTGTFPRDEQYGLTAQLRRAAVSVVSNIAEGQGRLSKPDFRHFVGQARGSLFEVETQLEIAGRLGYLPTEILRDLKSDSGEIASMLNGLITALSSRPGPTSS